MNKFIVRKQFAVGGTIYGVGDIVEMAPTDVKQYTDSGVVEPFVVAPAELQIDHKGISDAIAAGFARFAPAAPAQPVQGLGEYMQGIAKKTINITTSTQGQAATTTLWDPNIDVDLLKPSSVASRAMLTSLTGTNNIYKKNVVSSLGTAPAIVTESTPSSASQPLVTPFTFTLEKCTYVFIATEEALEDTGALVSEVISAIPDAFSKFIENGIINTTGTVLTGIVGNSNTVVTPYVSLQPAGSIITENINAMFARAKDPGRSIWIMSRTAYAKVLGLEDSGGSALFQANGRLSESPYGTLLGLPIVVSDFCQAAGTVGDIILADMSKYQLVAKGGMRMASSAELKFLEAQTVFRFIYRVAGKPIGLKLTATDGSEIGSFVTLDDRLGST